MTKYTVQLENNYGDTLYPKTKASVVINNDGDDLGDVEAGAQVNTINTIYSDGSALSIEDKAVTLPKYTIVEDTSDSAWNVYGLYKNSQTLQGVNIEVPVITAGDGITVSDNTISLSDDIVTNYTGGDGITVSGTTISLTDDVSTVDDVFDAVYPVGRYVIQLSGESDPATQFGRGTWKNVSSNFGGGYIRIADYGNAPEMNTLQAQGLPNIEGSFRASTNLVLYNKDNTNKLLGVEDVLFTTSSTDDITTIFASSCTTSTGSSVDKITFDASAYNSLYGAADEVCAGGYSCRVWQRTA